MSRTAVVLAGGLGTRLTSITGGTIPKAMVPVLGRPFIDYKLRSLSHLGVVRIVLLLGLGGEQVAAHVGDGGEFGLEVDCVFDGPELLGTGGAIRKALARLPEAFWVTYGDSLVWADLSEAEHAVEEANAEGLMTVLENDNTWGQSNVTIDDGVITSYSKGSPAESASWIDYGLLYLRANLFQGSAAAQVGDLEPILGAAVSRRGLLAMPVEERFWEIGTPEALADTERHFDEVSMWKSLT